MEGLLKDGMAAGACRAAVGEDFAGRVGSLAWEQGERVSLGEGLRWRWRSAELLHRRATSGAQSELTARMSLRILLDVVSRSSGSGNKSTNFRGFGS